MKAHGRMNICINGEYVHYAGIYSPYGPECAVHEDAASIFRFFADGLSDQDTITSTVFTYSDAGTQHWTRSKNDATYRLTK